MAPEVRDLLRTAAHAVDDDVDVVDVRRRARALRRGRRVRGAVAGLAALVVMVLVVGSVQGRLSRREIDFVDTPPSAPAPAATDATDQSVRRGAWEALADGPLSPRVDPVSVWTGSEMVVWAGQDPERSFRPLDDGAAYDPATRTWRRIAAAPLGLTDSTAAVWTGTEMLVWAVTSAAAYDPDADRWRTLPEPPLDAAAEASAVWTGEEMIVWGGYGDASGGASVAGAAYNPETDRWRGIPDAPMEPRLYHAAVWSGEEMLIWGGGAGDGAAAHQFADGAAYDPRSDSWRTLADSPLAERVDATVAWTGQEMLVFAGLGQSASFLDDGAAYDPSSDTWRRLPSAPGPGYWDAVWTGEQLVAIPHQATPAGRPRRTLIYDHLAAQWSKMDGTTLSGDDAAMVFTGAAVVAWGGLGPEGGLATGASLAVGDAAATADDTPAGPPIVATEADDDGSRAVTRYEHVSLRELGAAVLTHGGDGVRFHESGAARLVWPDPVRIAVPDGDGGVVLEADKTIVWVPRGDPARAITLVDRGKDWPFLRGLLPDGRAVFSITDRTDGEDRKERLFAIALAAGAEPDLLAATPAFQSWTTGPAVVADGTFVHASCHVVCTLRRGMADAGPDTMVPGWVQEQQAAIDGLVSTPDGGVIAFVMTTPAPPDSASPPRLVLLDGESFEPINVVDLPVTPEARRRYDAGQSMTIPEVSISADGDRVLVSFDNVYVIDDALTRPQISIVDFTGVVRWAGP